jgi:cyclopropane-fatty-acyl-phospholipid synthase
MKSTSPERLVPEIFASADVTVNGSRPWDIQVHHPHFYKRLAAGGSMALGESYMDGWWDCDALDQFFDRILRFRLDQQAKKTLKMFGVPSKRHAPAHRAAFGPLHRPPPLRHR